MITNNYKTIDNFEDASAHIDYWRYFFNNAELKEKDHYHMLEYQYTCNSKNLKLLENTSDASQCSDIFKEILDLTLIIKELDFQHISNSILDKLITRLNNFNNQMNTLLNEHIRKHNEQVSQHL